MFRLKKFETEVIALLSDGILDAAQLNSIQCLDVAEEYEYTGAGYFLTLSHAALPDDRKVLSSPFVVGAAGNVKCGFVGFLGDGKFILECHNWGEVHFPQEFRDLDVVISIEETNVITLNTGKH
jgi:hypothetical protein